MADFAKINNVWLMNRNAPNDYFPRRLTRLYLGNRGKENFERGVEMKKKFPNLFPSDEFNMSILQAVYAKLYDLWEREPNVDKKNIFKRYLDAILKNEWNRELHEIAASIADVRLIHLDDPMLEPAEIDNIRREIHQAYRGAGFTYNYFGWVNENNIYIKAKRGEVPLRPDTFEAASFFRNDSQQYREIIQKIEKAESRWGQKRGNSIILEYFLPRCNVGKYMGWKKSTLVEAIRKSGLMRNVTTLGTVGRIDGRVNIPTRGILYKDAGFNKDGVIVGLTDSMYGSSCYYDALYRKIFKPSGYIDWGYLCKGKYVDFHTLRHVAVKDFGIKYEDAKKMNYEQLCGEIRKFAEEHYKLTQKLGESLDLNIGTALALRPGSPWVKEAFKYNKQKVDDPFSQYKELKEFCERDDTTKEDLVQLTVNNGIRYLLPEKLEQYSKGDICKYLLDTYLPKAEKYESIAIDCDNQYIGKRQILNSAMIMGLGGILPKDVTNVSKEELCQIINNYVNVLKEAKALTLAPPK